MKYCIECGKQLDDASNYCPECGTVQNAEKVLPAKRAPLPATIITLSIITILGSACGIIRGLFYQTFAGLFESVTSYNEGYQRGYILMFLNAGTLIAAILMLNLNRFGYYLYLFFQIAYLAFIFYITLIYSSYSNETLSLGNAVNPLILLMGAFFWLPSIIMLILYLTLGRKYFFKQKDQ